MLLLALAACAAASPFTPEMASFIRSTMADWHVPGIALAVIDGSSVYTDAFGYAQLPDTPATPETLWFGGSTTKAQLAATLSHILHSNSSFPQRWRTPISSILPGDFVLADEWATHHITLEDAVSHRSGLPRHDVSWTLDLDGKKPLPGPTVRNLRNLPLTAEPRTTFQYCNLMFVTLTHVVETITGRWLGDVLRDVLWKPLGMDATFLTVEDARAAGGHIAMGYYWHEKELRHVAIENDTIQLSSGAGGVVTNVHDYAKWLQCLMGRTAPLSEAVHADIRAPRFIASGPSPDLATDLNIYSLGWDRTLMYGHVVYKHNGGTASMNTNLYWFPDLNYGLVAFGNVANRAFGAEEVIFHRFIQDKLSLPPDQRVNATKPLWKLLVQDPMDEMVNAVNGLYPDLPSPPLPPTLSADELQGTYASSGYGTLTFVASPDPRDESAPAVLVAYKDDAIFPMTLILRHASGDFWVLYLTIGATDPEASLALSSFAGAEFKIGPGGRAEQLVVEWSKPGNGLRGVTTVFECTARQESGHAGNVAEDEEQEL